MSLKQHKQDLLKITNSEQFLPHQLSDKANKIIELAGENIQSLFDITFSMHYKKLFAKPQVHVNLARAASPELEFNPKWNTRGKHSLEGAVMARLFGKLLVKKLGDDVLGENISLALEQAISVHDLENLPLGHNLEVITRDFFNSSWMEKNFYNPSVITDNERSELKYFDANQQTLLELVTKPELGMLNSAIAATMKYPWGVSEVLAGRKKKFGYNEYIASEVKNIAQLTSMVDKGNGVYARHPFAYLTEAFDDISYVLADPRDLVDMGKMNERQIRDLYIKIAEAENEPAIADMHFRDLQRSAAIVLVGQTLDVFEQNFAEMIKGSYEGELLNEVASKDSFLELRNLSIPFFSLRDKAVFSNKMLADIEETYRFITKVTVFGDKVQERDTEIGEKIMRFTRERLMNEESLYEHLLLAINYVCAMTDTEFLAKTEQIKSFYKVRGGEKQDWLPYEEVFTRAR